MIIVKHKKGVLLCLCIYILALLCSGCAIFEKENKEKVSTTATIDEQKELDADSDVTPTVQTKQNPEVEMVGAPSQEQVKNAVLEVHTEKEEREKKKEKEQSMGFKQEYPQPIVDNKPFWQSENNKQYQNLKAVAAAAQAAYEDIGSKAGWISKNGKMYSYYTGNYITTNTLVESGYLEAGLSDTDYEILLVNGRDVAQLLGVEVPSEYMKFAVFASCKAEDGQVLLACAKDKIGRVSSINYLGLLTQYNQTHGQVGRLLSSSAEYSRILNFVGLYEGKLEEFFVREIKKDDKYAVVTFSTRQNTANVKQHILRNDNDFWEVVYTDLQNVYHPIISVNRALPDFNLELLPSYHLYTWKGSLYQKNDALLQALMQKKIIKDPSEIYYQCGTNEYFYVVRKDGERFVCHIIDGVWQIANIDSDTAAKQFIEARTGEDYGFIILDD